MARCIVRENHVAVFCRKFGYLLAYSYLCKPLQMKGYEPKTS